MPPPRSMRVPPSRYNPATRKTSVCHSSCPCKLGWYCFLSTNTRFLMLLVCESYMDDAPYPYHDGRPDNEWQLLLLLFRSQLKAGRLRFYVLCEDHPGLRNISDSPI